MKIIDNTIIFKSDPVNFDKELKNKPCTIRRISLWSEMRDFEVFYHRYDANKKSSNPQLYHIKIINSSTHEEFDRIITDITEFEGLWVISWKCV